MYIQVISSIFQIYKYRQYCQNDGVQSDKC